MLEPEERTLGWLLSAMEIERHIEVQQGIRALYESMSLREAKYGSDGIKEAEWLLKELPGWVATLKRRVDFKLYDPEGVI